MRAKDVYIGRRVRIIKFERKTFGTVNGVQRDIVSVRLDGEKRGRLFSANDLHKIEVPK